MVQRFVGLDVKGRRGVNGMGWDGMGWDGWIDRIEMDGGDLAAVCILEVLRT